MARATFLHTADLHLSRPFGFLPPQLAEERRRDQRRALMRIADLALEREVELVLIAGDLFDTPDPDPADLEAVSKQLARLGEAGRRVFAIPGNHDYVSRASFWRNLDLPGLHVFLEPEWSSVQLDDLGVSIRGIAFDRGKSDRRAFEDFELTGDCPEIVLLHASYEAFEGQIERYHPFTASDLPNVSYVALGHYHRFNTIAAGETIACYPGTPEGISFDGPETEDRVVVLGEIADDGEVRIEHVKVNQRVMRSAEIDCTSLDSQSSLFDAVRKFCEPNALIEVKLTGIPTSGLNAVLAELPDRFKDSCAYMAVNARGLSLPADIPADDRTIRGRFCKHMFKQIEESANPERAKVLMRALELGLAAFSEEQR
jgi:DNA repair exonuclease SbcCD nuclease subunit